MGSRRHHRVGFSALELLVAVAIIAVLVSLLVPAVQKVRETASRMQCANNLRQIGVALHNFHGAKNGFPPALWTEPDREKVAVGWMPYILPYIDREPLFKEYDFNTRWDAKVNENVIKTEIPLYLCPTAPRVAGNQGRGRTDYAATSIIDRNPNPFLKRPVAKIDATFIGVMGHNVYRNITEILDGASNTLMVAEDAGQPEQWIMGQMVKLKGGSGAWASPATNLKITGFNPVTMSTPGPCAVNCYNNNEMYSFHVGGANALFADGSVHFLHARLNLNIGVALFTRKGDEHVRDDIYD